MAYLFDLRARLGIAAAVVSLFATLALTVVGGAHAGLLTPPCNTTAIQPFSLWSDASYYALVPGGSFEGTSTWTLTNGAKIVAGNEPYYVTTKSDTKSLYLPAGSSATSPGACFALGDWHLRFFAINKGPTSTTLRVSVVVKSLLGVVSVLDGGTISAGGTWAPSPTISLLLTNIAGLLTTDKVSFRFTPVGSGAAFQIDDVYLDPFKGS